MTPHANFHSEQCTQEVPVLLPIAPNQSTLTEPNSSPTAAKFTSQQPAAAWQSRRTSEFWYAHITHTRVWKINFTFEKKEKQNNLLASMAVVAAS